MSLGNALSYLTVLPIPFRKQVPLGRSVHYFPLVGVGMGSLLVLFFLALKAFLPTFLACIGVVALLEAMTGGIHLRAVAEMAGGKRTFPGAGFGPKSEFHWKGKAAIALVLVLKVTALSEIRVDWQPFALLLAPILGRSSQALGIIFSRHRQGNRPPDRVIKRRQIRALFYTAGLLLVFLLFPWRVALALAAQYFAVLVICYRRLNRSQEGLTVQTLGTVAEAAETAFLIACAVFSLL